MPENVKQPHNLFLVDTLPSVWCASVKDSLHCFSSHSLAMSISFSFFTVVQVFLSHSRSHLCTDKALTFISAASKCFCKTKLFFSGFIVLVALKQTSSFLDVWMLSSYCFPTCFTLSLHFKEHFLYCIISHIVI